MTKTQTEKTNDVAIKDEVVMSRIYYIRDQKVMLDRDLAELYGVETKRLNEQVRRNAARFPEDFMFQLTEEEFGILKSQIATSSWGGRRKLPSAFSEHGVLMLSSVLNSEQAVQVNIQIMRVFTRIRHMITDNTELRLEIADIKKAVHKISKKQDGQDKNIELIFEYIDRLQEKAALPGKGITVVSGFGAGKE